MASAHVIDLLMFVYALFIDVLLSSETVWRGKIGER